jgi:hypothetical protein
MLASRVSGKRVLVVLAGVTVIAGVAALPSPDEPAPAKPDSYRFVALSGDPLAQVVDDLDGDWQDQSPHARPLPPGESCLPFLAPLTAHPRWQVQIAHAFSDCMGATVVASFSIGSDGKVVWSAPGMPDRELELTSEQLATVRGLDRLDCVRTEPVGYGEEHFRIGIGGGIRVDGGAHISRHSTLGEALAKLFEDVLAAYYQRRIAAFAPITADVTYHGYHLALRGTHLAVSYGRRIFSQRDLEASDLGDLLDTMIDGPDAPHARDDYTGFGTFTASGITVPLAVERFERGALEVLARGFEDAIYYREQR